MWCCSVACYVKIEHSDDTMQYCCNIIKQVMSELSILMAMEYCASVMEEYHITGYYCDVKMQHCNNIVEHLDSKNGEMRWHITVVTHWTILMKQWISVMVKWSLIKTMQHYDETTLWHHSLAPWWHEGELQCHIVALRHSNVVRYSKIEHCYGKIVFPYSEISWCHSSAFGAQ